LISICPSTQASMPHRQISSQADLLSLDRIPPPLNQPVAAGAPRWPWRRK
jgi:hypothetical protein